MIPKHKRNYLLSAMLFLLFLFAGSYAYNEFFSSKDSELAIIVPLEYSAPECFNSTLWVMFFNPSDTEVSNISIFSGDTIYANLGSLESNSPGAVALGPCDSIDVPSLSLRYCVDVCTVEPFISSGKPIGSGLAEGNE